MQRAKDEANAKQLQLMLETLKQATSVSVAEGKHDLAALADFAIPAISCPQLFANGVRLKGKTLYLLMDLDRGGEEKGRKAEAFVQERHPEARINNTLGPRLLKLLGIRSVEQMRKPASELLEKGKGEGRTKNKKM